MAVLRSSLFNLKTEDQIVSIGPNAVLDSLLGAADRGVDRRRAISRSQDANEIMKDVSFTKSHAALSAFCLTLLQNASPQDQQKLRDAVNALQQRKDMTDSQKAKNLGLLLMNLVGPQVLRSAVDVLRDEIQVRDPDSLTPQKAEGTASGEIKAKRVNQGTSRQLRRKGGSSPTPKTNGEKIESATTHDDQS